MVMREVYSSDVVKKKAIKIQGKKLLGNNWPLLDAISIINEIDVLFPQK